MNTNYTQVTCKVWSFMDKNIECAATYDGVSPGHQMSQADATSLEGEAPATTGCYKQYEHAIPNKLQQSTDPNQVRATSKFHGASFAKDVCENRGKNDITFVKKYFYDFS